MDDLVAEFGPRPSELSNLRSRHLYAASPEISKVHDKKIHSDAAKMTNRTLVSDSPGRQIRNKPRRDNNQRINDAPSYTAPIEQARNPASIWQKEADDEEWSAWVDATEADSGAGDQAADEQLAWSASPDQDAIPRKKSLENVLSTDNRSSEWFYTVGKEKRLAGPPSIEAFTYYTAPTVASHIHSNPWHEEEHPTTTKERRLNCRDFGVEKPVDAHEASSSWNNVSLRIMPVEDNDVDADVQFNPWRHGDESIKGEEITPTSQARRDLSTANGDLHRQALTRDETQRQLVIQHCLRSKKYSAYSHSGAVMASISTSDLIAWIHRFVERIRAKPKVA